MLMLIGGCNRHWQDGQIINRGPQGQMGKTPMEGAELIGRPDLNHRLRAFRENPDNLLRLQQFNGLLEEVLMPLARGVERESPHRRHHFPQHGNPTHVVVASKSDRTIHRRHQQGRVKHAAVVADDQEAGIDWNPIGILHRYGCANGTK